MTTQTITQTHTALLQESKTPDKTVNTTLYNEQDINLLASNALKVIIDSNVLELPLDSELLSLITYGRQQIAAYKAIPDSAFIEKRLAHPMIHLLSTLDHTVYKISTVATLVGVINNSVIKCINYFKKSNPTRTAIETARGALVHILNVGYQLFLAKHVFDNPPSGPDGLNTYYEDKTKPSNVDPSTYKNMNNMDRLTKAGLNTTSYKDAAAALKVTIEPECKEAAKQSWMSSGTVSERCKDTCTKIKIAFRQLFLDVHPDKNQNNKDQSLAASQNLSNFKDTLDMYYQCGKFKKD